VYVARISVKTKDTLVPIYLYDLVLGAPNALVISLLFTLLTRTV